MELQFPFILDGATGTELQKKGFDSGISAEEWVLQNPEAIISLQKGYVEAGSNMVYAPTFGANRPKLESHGIFNRTAEFNKKLVALSKEAVGGKACVAGDLAPTGLMMYPSGETSFQEIYEIYLEQAKALEEAGVDLFGIETLMSVPEARAALLAVKSVSDKPVLVSFTCDAEGKTLSGSDVGAALLIMQGMGVDAFGLNCSVGPKDMETQIRRLSRMATVPLIVKPNAGLPQIIDGKTVYDCPAEEFGEEIASMAEYGVFGFGGCCGTDASHIASIRNHLEGKKFTPVAPLHSKLLPCATEKNAFFLQPDTPVGNPLACDANLESSLMAALAEDTPVVSIRINKMDELDYFNDCQHLISKPLCIFCDDAQVLEQALMIYHGRAMYEGGLNEDVLAEMEKRFGLLA